jgi:hypothetical protein
MIVSQKKRLSPFRGYVVVIAESISENSGLLNLTTALFVLIQDMEIENG